MWMQPAKSHLVPHGGTERGWVIGILASFDIIKDNECSFIQFGLVYFLFLDLIESFSNTTNQTKITYFFAVSV